MLFGCKKGNLLVYNLSDAYSGPCIVFVYDTIIPNSQNNIEFENGFSRITKKLLKRKFIFKSVESKNEIEIIPIGKIEYARPNVRYIFGLVNGYKTSSRCEVGDIYNIIFFVGTKEEYNKWTNEFNDEFTYFESIGIDWCKYYKNLSN